MDDPSQYRYLFDKVIGDIKRNVWYSVCREIDAKAGELFGLTIAENASRTATSYWSRPPENSSGPAGAAAGMYLPPSNVITPPEMINYPKNHKQQKQKQKRSKSPKGGSSRTSSKNTTYTAMQPSYSVAKTSIPKNIETLQSLTTTRLRSTQSSSPDETAGQVDQQQQQSPADSSYDTAAGPSSMGTIFKRMPPPTVSPPLLHIKVESELMPTIEQQIEVVDGSEMIPEYLPEEYEYPAFAVQDGGGEYPEEFKFQAQAMYKKQRLNDSAAAASEDAEDEADESEVDRASDVDYDPSYELVNSSGIRRTRQSASMLRSFMFVPKEEDPDAEEHYQHQAQQHQVIAHTAVESNTKVFRCGYDLTVCQFSSYKRSNTHQHIRRVHFKLPATEKEQLKKRINDDRDANQYILGPEPLKMDMDSPTSFGGGALHPDYAQTSKDDSKNSDILVMKFFKEVSLNCTVGKCDVTVIGRDALNEHLLKVHKVKPYRCLLRNCGRSFQNGTALSTHLREAHPHQKDFNCPRCDSQISDHISLHKHTVNFHNTGRFECSNGDCDFWAPLRRTVMNHWKIHHSMLFTCDHGGCGKQYRNKSEMINHQRREHEDEEE